MFQRAQLKLAAKTYKRWGQAFRWERDADKAIGLAYHCATYPRTVAVAGIKHLEGNRTEVATKGLRTNESHII